MSSQPQEESRSRTFSLVKAVHYQTNSQEIIIRVKEKAKVSIKPTTSNLGLP